MATDLGGVAGPVRAVLVADKGNYTWTMSTTYGALDVLVGVETPVVVGESVYIIPLPNGRLVAIPEAILTADPNSLICKT